MSTIPKLPHLTTRVNAFLSILIFQGLFLLQGVTSLAFAQDNQQISAPSKLVKEVQQAPSRVEDLDGKVLDATRVRVDRVWQGDTCSSSVTNISSKSLHVGNIILFDLSNHHLPPSTPIYGEGFQKLAQTSGPIGKPDCFGPFGDFSHYHIPQPGGLPTVYGMMTCDLGAEGQALLGFSSCKRFIGRFSFDGTKLQISVDPEGLELAPGETWKLEDFLAISGPDRNVLLDRLAAELCRNQPPLPQPPLADRSGWCTYYGVGGAGNQKIITETVDRFASVLPQLKYIQIDEGYQLEGDLLDIMPQFGDMQATVDAIRAKGFSPAIWVAPFIAAPNSKTLAEHPDWFVKGPDGSPLSSDKIGFGGWKNEPWRVLDGTNPAAQKHLEEVFRFMRQKWGITYFKLDANYWGAIHGGIHFDPKATRVEAYRRGMEAVLRGAGPGAVVLGCNAPMWPSLGLVNAMRTSNDIGRSWGSFSSSGRENLNRDWQNGRLWVNDPDVIELAGKADITPNQWQFRATIISAVGGLILDGDKVEDLGPAQLAMLRKMIPPTGKGARFDSFQYDVGETDVGDLHYHYLFNWTTKPVDRTFHLDQRSRLKNFWTDEDLGIHEGDFSVKDMPGQSAVIIVSSSAK